MQVSGAMNMVVIDSIVDVGAGGLDVNFYQSAQGSWFITLSQGGNAPFAELNIGLYATCMAIGKGVGVVAAAGSPLLSAVTSFAVSNACKWGLQDYYPDDGNDGDGY